MEVDFRRILDQADWRNQTLVVAVSGGVDSVALLDLLVAAGHQKLIVAHFDHQIRGQASARDAEFVRQLARKYSLKYELCHGGLGARASEAEARAARYQFLRAVAMNHQAELVTAHHFDDVVETIALNLTRGTGWRGLAVMRAADVWRPLLNFTKDQLYDYANARGLAWCEDATNQNPKYLRNRLRRDLILVDFETKQFLFDLYRRQLELAAEIDQLCAKQLAGKSSLARYFLIMAPDSVALELVRSWLGVTRPMAEQVLWAIKTAPASSRFKLSPQAQLKFSIDQVSLLTNQPS